MMTNEKWENQTNIAEVNFLGFGDIQDLRIPLFSLFLLTYICTMAGNILIIVLVISEPQIHTPMYFFLGNLSCLDTCTVCTILPKMLACILTRDGNLALWGCVAQFYFFASLTATQCYLLAMMSYDRYLAICKPLHYVSIMNARLCVHLATGCWINGFLGMSVFVVLISQLVFCGPKDIDHFFCEVTQIVKLSCSGTETIELLLTVFSCIFSFPPFTITVASYIHIIKNVMRIPSATGKKKAFSTCSSHLIVVSIFYGTLMLVYVAPKTEELRALNKIFAVFYTVLTPLLNPVIYSLRNREIKEALKKILKTCV